MVCFLPGNVVPDGCLDGRAHREGGVAFLPVKGEKGNGFGNPDRGVLYQVPHEIGQAMRGFEPDEKVNVTGAAAIPPQSWVRDSWWRK
jgi:hypothetical protein